MKPIVALATAPIKSAIHVIRLSGDGIFSIINSIFTKKLNHKDRVYIGEIKDKNKFIDQVVIVTYFKPYSYTGEDVAEIMTHGNIIIDTEIIDLLVSRGVRLAVNGEFTSRAYLNHKLDLVQAEAVNDLINATTLESKELISHALTGETSNLLLPIKKALLDLISNIEVNIDYPEYQDIEEVNRKRINKELVSHKKNIDKLIKDAYVGLVIKDGVKIAIVGKPNVGKSTLLNALLKEDKAIVSNIPGTTRDIVEGDVNIDGIVLHLLDTAGIRVSKNKIESIGVKKAYKAIKDADIVIYLKNSVKDEHLDIDNKRVIEVINKADLIKKKDDKHLYISALHHNIAPLINKIKKELGVKNNAFKSPMFMNARELGLLKSANQTIDEILSLNKKNAPIDVIAVLLNSLLNIILEIFGEKASLDITKEIFSRFCVGK